VTCTRGCPYVLSASSGAVVGVVGVIAGAVVTYRSGERQQATALAIARIQIEGQLEVDREQLRQRRAETAYTVLIEDAIRARSWALDLRDGAMRMMSGQPGTGRLGEGPVPPSVLPITSLFGDPPAERPELSAYWTRDIRQLVSELRECLHTLREGAVYFEMAHRDRGAIEEWVGPEAVERILNRVEAVERSVDLLRDHISMELNGFHNGHADRIIGNGR
jgi:hypothetical protein